MLVKEGEDVPDSPMSGRSSLRDGGFGSGTHLPRSGVVEVDRLRDVVRHKEDQLAALQQQLTGLEATRDRYFSDAAFESGLLNLGKLSKYPGKVFMGVPILPVARLQPQS